MIPAQLATAYITLSYKETFWLPATSSFKHPRQQRSFISQQRIAHRTAPNHSIRAYIKVFYKSVYFRLFFLRPWQLGRKGGTGWKVNPIGVACYCGGLLLLRSLEEPTIFTQRSLLQSCTSFSFLLKTIPLFRRITSVLAIRFVQFVLLSGKKEEKNS